MHSRLDLKNLLESIMPDNQKNVYYQPPESYKMNYPAIVYEISDIDNKFADNNVYMQSHEYSLTVIDKKSDSEIVEKVSQLPRCKFNRHFTSDNLNHTIFTLYY